MPLMNIYAAGGAGINIGRRFLPYKNNKEKGMCDLRVVMLDTSNSNIRDLENYPDIYILDGLDGSGKKRDLNYGEISNRCMDILHQFKPADINIVVHSASGGSGSVIAPVLVSELLSRGDTVIVVMVGSSDSKIEAVNTINTLKSYEMISKKRNLPVVATYHENTRETPRGVVDQKVHVTIALLSCIFSNQIDSMDTTDLRHFLNYPKVTSHDPSLSYLDFHSKDIKIDRDMSLLALLSITDSNTDYGSPIPVEYQSVGLINDYIKEAISVDLPLHAVILGGYFNPIVDRMTGRINEVEAIKATKKHKSLVNGESSTDDGLIL